MKKLNVNENCIGCGMCAAIDPEHFEIVDGLSLSLIHISEPTRPY